MSFYERSKFSVSIVKLKSSEKRRVIAYGWVARYGRTSLPARGVNWEVRNNSLVLEIR